MRIEQLAPLALLGLLGASTAALAQVAPPATALSGSGEPSPWVIGIGQTFTTDDNLFRAPEGSGRVVKDRISSTRLRAGLDQTFGRQRLTLDAGVGHNRYRTNDQLNNTDYQVGGRLDWQTVERVSGEISARQRESLFRETVAGVVSSDRNQVRESSAAFQARVGLVTRWSFEAGAAASENKYKGEAVVDRDVRQQAVNAGIRWQPSDRFGTRIGVRHSEGRYPQYRSSVPGATPGPDEFKRDDIDFIGNFTPSGASRLDVRVSATREEHTQQTQRDSDGWTGALGWRWRPTGKLDLGVDLSRDSSVGRTEFGSSLIDASASDAVLSEIARLSLTYSATAKIQVIPRFTYARRKLDGFDSPTGTSGDSRDKTTAASIGLRYQPITALDLGCDYLRERRKAEGTQTAPYTASVVTCSAEFALR